ncbi:MAG: septum formation family protein [Actinobacteria bacterium]|nr:septum formation family protein [Actinomycetota bacterium]
MALAMALALAGCAGGPRDGSGQVTAPATTDSYSVRVGDCLDKLPSESADALPLLPCSSPHYWEAFATSTLTASDFPGNPAVKEQAQQACDAEFEPFIGLAAKKSKLDLTMLTPTRETWTQAGDREVVCLVGSSTGNITGTLKGAAK